MKQIVVLKGDGIGPELVDSALSILNVASQESGFEFETAEYPFGGAGIDEVGEPCSQELIQACQSADAILLGAIGGPQWVDAKETPEDGLLKLRSALKLYANLRPTQINDKLIDLSPLKADRVKGTDFIIVRELIGGLYFGRPKYYDDKEAFDTLYYSKADIERIVRAAFDIAMTRNKKLTSVDKANVLASSKLWRQVVNEVASDYPEVAVDHLYVDAASMKIITNPSSFDVIVTENLFGDILSDEASVITGSLGMLPSASLSENGPALYEPIHGSAPDIAGQDIANPMSMILSITMMLRQSFSEHTMADKIEAACEKVMADGYLTGDLGGDTPTSVFTKQVINELTK